MTDFWRGANVLITGVSGTLGTALSKHLLSDEYGISRLAGIARKWQPVKELETKLSDKRFRPFIGDVRDIERLRLALRGVDIVIHAAALKDVLLGQYNPTEIVQTNVSGSDNVFRAALDCGVKRVMFISSDKACNADNAYGSSKHLAECLAVSYNSYSGSGETRYSACRYGNVAGSSGSVIPLFISQRESGRLTITHDKMTRFWITLDEAVSFVLRATEEMMGGEIFVPRLYSTRIVNLATAIAPTATIEVVGIRPGEKLHEVMISISEARSTQDVGWAYRIEPQFNSWSNSPYPGGSPVPFDFIYSSASAPRLTDDQIKVIVGG